MSKGTIIGTLRADIADGEGLIEWEYRFHGLSPIMRADVLKDIKHEIDAAYEQAVRDLTPAKFREAEH